MRLLVPAATAALIVCLALSATAAASPRDPDCRTAGAARSPAEDGAPTTTAPATTATVPTGRFGWPLAPRPAVARPFDQPDSQWGSGHRGVDLIAMVGQPVLSAGDGTVAFSGVIAGRGVMTVRHAGGLRTTYEPVDTRLSSGTGVDRGTPIGVVSPTPGHCAPRTCLHWGAIDGQTYRDPLSLLGFGRPILLPLG